MRKILWLSLLTAVCGITSVHADVTIVERIDGMGTSIDSTEMVKDGHTRVDYPGGFSTIRDLKTGEMVRLLGSQKSYARLPGRMTQTALDAMRQGRTLPKSGEFTLTPTGKKDTISVYAAEECIYSAGGTKISLWLTKAAPDYANILKEISAEFNRGSISGMLVVNRLDAVALPGFPVRMACESPPGQTITATVLSISTAPIPDSEFQIPADYKDVTAPRANTPPLDAGMPK